MITFTTVGASRVASDSLCTHAGAITPAGPLGVVAHLAQRQRPSRLFNPVDPRITLFEACSAFTHVTACMLAWSPKVTVSKGFDRFVTSTTALVATNRSDQLLGGILTH